MLKRLSPTYTNNDKITTLFPTKNKITSESKILEFFLFHFHVYRNFKFGFTEIPLYNR